MSRFTHERDVPLPLTEEQRNKLPKWAQGYIDQLGWALRDRDDALNKKVQAEESRLSVAYQKVYFPDHTTFEWAWDEYTVVHAGLAHDNDRLRLSSTNGRLLVYPEASNTITVMPERR